ncbi:hypothetical protein ACE4Z5_24745, partial [Salmonella enterica]
MKSMIVAAVAAVLGLAAPALAEAPGVTDKEIVIGTHQDLSGPVVSWGQPVTNGMRMAVDEINAR